MLSFHVTLTFILFPSFFYVNDDLRFVYHVLGDLDYIYILGP